MRKITLLLILLSFSFSLSAQTYLQENFDASIPATWSITDGGANTGDSWISGQQGGANNLDGSNGAVVDSDADGDGVLLIETLTSPAFDTSGAVGLFLDFDQFFRSLGGDSAVVEVFDGTNWVEVLNQTATIGAFGAPDQQHINITAYSNANLQVRFIYDDGDNWAWYWMLDNFHVYNTSCENPSGITLNSVGQVTADISWTAGGTETAWEIVIQAAGTGLPTGTGTAVGANTYNATGLSPVTAYEVYILADCGGANGQSEWVGPLEFITLNYPPPPPTGVTCASGTSTFVFTEGFGTDGNTDPFGWTGTGFSGLNGNWDISVAGGNSGGTGPANAYDNGTGVHLEYEAGGNATNIASVISPAIDLTTALDGAELAFFMHAFGNDTGILNVNIGTSATGTFTPLYTWVGGYQTTDIEAWVPIGIDLTPYLGQVIYLEFSYGGAGTGFEGDLSIDQITVETCGAFCIAPNNLMVSNITATTADIAWSAVNGETEWQYVIQPAGTGTPTGAGTIVNATTLNATGLSYDTDYEIYVLADCGTGTSLYAGPVSFSTTILLDFTVDCAVGTESFNYCYINNDTNMFTFTSTDGSSLSFTINAGQVESGWDELIVLDSDGVTDLNAATPYGNAGDVSGITYQSSGDTISFGIDSDGSGSCELSGYIPFDVTIACATCTNPTATYTVVSDCINGPQFYIDTDVTSLGTAASVTVTDNQSNSQQVSTTGIVTFGPYANNTDVFITIASDTDINCSVISDSLTQDICLDHNVDCTAGAVDLVYCYENSDTNVFTFTSNDGNPLTFIVNSGQVENGWDELVIIDVATGTDLNAATPYGADGDVGGLVYQSSGDSISFQVQSDGSINCSGNGFIPIDVSVSCATCLFHDVEFSTVANCTTGTGFFFIDVNVIDLGSAATLDIYDGTTTVSTTTTGVTQVGPYPIGGDITIVVSNQDDVNCVVNSGVVNVLTCPPANDDCDNAVVVIANPDENCTNTTSGTIYGATQSPQGNVCGGSSNDDVWFSFVAVSTDHAISLNNIVGDTTFLNFGLYEGVDCTSLTNIGCENADQIVANGLTVGETYYVQVYSFGNLDYQDTIFDLCIITLPPPITTNTTQYTVQELVEDVLIDSPCSLVSNITFSTGTNFGSTNGIGYFEANGSSFPFESGLIMTTGDDANAVGPETGTISDGGCGWPGDADLEAEIGEGATLNASIIEFDFVPITPQMSFDFIFAAEEYGTFQCNFSDAFAFLLTDASGNTVNIALVPGSATPVSVFSIRDEAFNGGCLSASPEFFDAYYDVNDFPATGQNPLTSPTNFRGRTVPLTASSTVIPNDLYHIKLVIADDGDNLFDSAVFLSAGSFDIGTIDLGDDILLTSGNANCLGDEVVLDIGIEIPNNSVLTWFYTNPGIPGILNPITGENTTMLTVNETGIYTAEILITGTSCYFTDEVLIEFFANPMAAFDEEYIIKCANEEYDLIVNLENADELLNPLTYNFYLEGNLIQSSNSNIYTLTTLAEQHGNITVTVTDDVTGCNGGAAMLIEFYENSYCVDQPQGLSPNGDNVNDCLILDHLEDRRDIVKAEVFNRYGAKVWELSGYVDQWCGLDKEGNLLPVGTYYYNIYLKNKAKPLTSFIYLNY